MCKQYIDVPGEISAWFLSKGVISFSFLLSAISKASLRRDREPVTTTDSISFVFVNDNPYKHQAVSSKF